MLDYKEIMRKIAALETVVKDLSQTIEQVSRQSDDILNPTADLCQNLYENLLEFYSIPKSIQIKHLKGMIIVEFYKEQCANMLTAGELKVFYQACKMQIDTQFALHPDKARFLQLMMMLQLVDKPQTPITNDHIEIALKLFETELAIPKAKTEFEDFFARGAMVDFKSLDQFIESIELYLNPSLTNEQHGPKNNNFSK